MFVQFFERHRPIDRFRIADHVQVVLAEIDDPLALLVLHVGVANVPLVRHDPVETLGARRHFVDRQLRQPLAEQPQRFPHAVAGQAAADGKQPAGEVVHGFRGH